MHETVIAKSIIEQAQKQGEVAKIVLEIGELAHVPPNELVECLMQMVDYPIEFTEIPSQVECDQCGFCGHPKVLERGHDSFFIECPRCQLAMPKVVSGTEVKLVSVDVK